MDPLVTRSLPTGLWRWMPSTLVSADESLRASAVQAAQGHLTFWSWAEYFTANPTGIALAFLVLFFISMLWLGPRFFWSQNSTKRNLKRTLFYLIAIGFSDLCASLLKIGVGRLKPHVAFYNPAVFPALSFPSNHAVNFSFLALLLALRMSPEQRRRHPGFLIFLLAATLFTGLSRVMVGQHYPLDIFAGFALGCGLAIPVARLADRW